jgi:hypothetical protein
MRVAVKHITHHSVLCAVALTLTCCATQSTPVAPALEPELAPAPAPPVAPAPWWQPAPRNLVSISAASATKNPLRVAVMPASGEDADSRALAPLMTAALQQQILARHDLTPSATPDVIVTLACTGHEADRAGDLRAYAGEAALTITRAFDQQRLGHTNITARGTRSVEVDRARAALATQLAAALAPSLTAALDAAAAGLALRTITVTRTAALDTSPAYAQQFIARVAALPGVVACRLTRQAAAGDELVFSLAYFSGAFREGVLNRLLSLPELSLTAKP